MKEQSARNKHEKSIENTQEYPRVENVDNAKMLG
jgi:hypothetical protein